jgi:hypothetical protein
LVFTKCLYLDALKLILLYMLDIYLYVSQSKKKTFNPTAHFSLFIITFLFTLLITFWHGQHRKCHSSVAVQLLLSKPCREHHSSGAISGLLPSIGHCTDLTSCLYAATCYCVFVILCLLHLILCYVIMFLVVSWDVALLSWQNYNLLLTVDPNVATFPVYSLYELPAGPTAWSWIKWWGIYIHNPYVCMCACMHQWHLNSFMNFVYIWYLCQWPVIQTFQLQLQMVPKTQNGDFL